MNKRHSLNNHNVANKWPIGNAKNVVRTFNILDDKTLVKTFPYRKEKDIRYQHVFKRTSPLGDCPSTSEEADTSDTYIKFYKFSLFSKQKILQDFIIDQGHGNIKINIFKIIGNP
ncbi:hypothetical protein V1477_003309 [Vespula maculifrons]|uniref:Uncharacterized protein n=1 Tax=Vespula maculifrons TaxID=7453 RepID=A0ABD2CUH6_VESMC